MIPTRFHATNCTVTEEDGVLVTALGVASTDDAQYLMLQHTQEDDGQDNELDMDKPYIEFCDQRWSWYGHCLSFLLFRDRVQVQMDQHAAREMANDGLLVVSFTLGDDEFNSLRVALETTFNGQACFRDETGL